MTLDLTRLANGQGALGPDVHQFGDLLLGVMQDQPVNFKHQVAIGGGTSITAAQVPLTINGVAGQTADLLDIKATSGGATLLSVSNTGNLTTQSITGVAITLSASLQANQIASIQNVSAQGGQLTVQGDGGALASAQTFTSALGVGNGANTAVQAPAIGTGSGPANPLLVSTFLKVYTAAGATRWIPLMA